MGLTKIIKVLILKRRATIAKNIQGIPDTKSLLRLIETSLDEDKADDIVVIDLTGLTDIADFMVIANGTSRRHVGSMADHIQRKIKSLGVTDKALILVDSFDENLYLSSRNVPHVLVIEARYADPVSLVHFPKVIATAGSVKQLEEMFS